MNNLPAYLKSGNGTHWGIQIPFAPPPRHEYPQGHPCRGCPFQFPVAEESCTLGAKVQGECWYAAQRKKEVRQWNQKRIKDFEQRFRRVMRQTDTVEL